MATTQHRPPYDPERIHGIRIEEPDYDEPVEEPDSGELPEDDPDDEEDDPEDDEDDDPIPDDEPVRA